MKRVLRVSKGHGIVSNIVGILQTVQEWFRSMANGEYVLVLERVMSPRTIRQNNLMWLWFEAIAREWTESCGYAYDKQEVHDYYTKKFLPVILPNGDRVGGKTRGLDTEKMTWLMDSIQADAASEYGIELPTADDLRFEEWRRQYE